MIYLFILFQQNRIRDIVSILSSNTKILREVTNSNKANDHKHSIFNFNNLEYSVQIQRKDTLYFLYDKNDGILAKLGLCPQLIQIYNVVDTNQQLMGGSFVDNNIPCLCGLGSSSIAEQLLQEDETIRGNTNMETDSSNEMVAESTEGGSSNNNISVGEFIPIDKEIIVRPTNVYNNLTTTPPELIKAIELKVPKAKHNLDIFWNEKIKELGLLQSSRKEELRILNDKNKSLESLLDEEKSNNSKLQYRLEILEKQLLKMTRPLLPLSNN